METFKVPELQGKMACVVAEVAIKMLDNICGVLPHSRALLPEVRIVSLTLLARLTQFSSLSTSKLNSRAVNLLGDRSNKWRDHDFT